MKKILLVIDSLGSGGAQRQITMLARCLAESGYYVDLVTYFPDVFFVDQIQHKNINHRIIHKKSKLGIGFVRLLRGIMKEHLYKCVISFLPTPNLYTVLAAYRTINQNRVIVSERSSFDFSQPSKKKFLRKLVNGRANGFVTNSKHELVNWLTNCIKISPINTFIYNCVDLNRFCYYKRSFNTFSVLVVAGVSPDKNGLCVIEAMKFLLDKGQLNFHVTWIGEKVNAIEWRREYIERMELKIDEYNMNQYWTWLDAKENIEFYYEQSDVLVHPSLVEGLPNVVCEALSTGLPVILSDVLDHPILADNGKNGLLFNPYSPEDLGNTIVKYFNLPKLSKSLMSSNCRKFAEENFSSEQFVNQYLRIIDKLSQD